MDKVQVIVIGVSRYNFPDKQTGEIIAGTKVHYFEHKAVDEENTVGYIPQTANLPYASFDGFDTVPGVYNAELTMSLRGRKPSLMVTGFEMVRPISMQPKEPVKG